MECVLCLPWNDRLSFIVVVNVQAPARFRVWCSIERIQVPLGEAIRGGTESAWVWKALWPVDGWEATAGVPVSKFRNYILR